MTRRAPLVRVWQDREIIVDSFAGGGGASTGIRDALNGRDADIAINHDPEAIALHRANHPLTRHFTEDVWRVDPVKAAAGRPVGLMWLSPDCSHHSKARGSKPVEKRIRGLAWVGVHWARKVKPRMMFLENVEEFEDWGPLVEVDGKLRPCPKRKGVTFKRWVRELRRLGYEVEWRQMSAMHYGTPTTRNRLFVIARCDGEPIVWPKPTHGKGLEPVRTAADIIQWDLPCPSIFGRSRPLAEKTLARIANGIQRYVIDDQQPFIVRNGHYFKDRPTTFRGQGMDRPLGTVCATNDKNLVLPFLREPGATGGGSTEPLVAAWIAKHYGGVVGHGMRRPLGTVTGKDHHSLVLAFLIKYYGGGGQLQGLREPLHTVTSKARFGLVTVAGTQYEIVDIGMRMLQPRELYRAQGFADSTIIDVTYEGQILTKKAQTRMAGNSVCPPMAKAVVEANTEGRLQ